MIRKEVAEKLIRINGELQKEKLALYIRSLWRSPPHQAEIRVLKFDFIKKLHPARTVTQINAIVSYFVPSKFQSMHHTGGAVEALIFDLESGQMLDFGSNLGNEIDLDVSCCPHYPDLSQVARKNRNLLIEIKNLASPDRGFYSNKKRRNADIPAFFEYSAFLFRNRTGRCNFLNNRIGSESSGVLRNCSVSSGAGSGCLIFLIRNCL